MKVRITDIHPESQFYQERDNIIGKIFDSKDMEESFQQPGWSLLLHYRGDISMWCKYEPVEEPAMSELAKITVCSATNSTDCKITVKNKKLSWLQKIRGYDRLAHELKMEVDNSNWLKENRVKPLQARCQSAESMRDHYKQTAELHEAVAKQWQQKAVEANKRADDVTNDYVSFLDELENELMEDQTGRRLKFSVGHNHIEIVVGNPVCTAQNYNQVELLLNGDDTATAFSCCNPKDTYNWKTGVIQALENLCHFWKYDKMLTQSLFEAMFKKYPELK
jgi:hypothetical protein